jgi:hypothetical protein
MSRTQEWLKNLFNIFAHHDQPGAPAVLEKDEAANKVKERGGRGEATGGGYKVTSEKQAKKLGTFSPFDKGTGGGGM